MSKATLAGLLVILLHLVGALGMSSDRYRELMLLLTPFNLLIVSAVTISFHSDHSRRFVIFSLLCVATSFAVEAVGVATGWPFGDYSYGSTLGVRCIGVPLIIGLNWLVLTLCTASLFRKIDHPVPASLAGALAMVFMDYLIEPVAVKYDYWTWDSENIPLENYIAWGFAAFIFHLALRYFNVGRENKTAGYVLGAQCGFFLITGFFGS